MRKVKKDPMAEVTGDAPDKWDKVVGMCLVSSMLHSYKTGCKINTMEFVQDYMQKMEATKKAVGMVKGKTVFKPKEGTPKVSLFLLWISRLKNILFGLSSGMKPRMMMAIFSTTTSRLQNQGNDPTFYP